VAALALEHEERALVAVGGGGDQLVALDRGLTELAAAHRPAGPR
jgi:hypothetical protein